MKRIILLVALAVGLSANAQKNVYLKIDHFLGSNSFAFNAASNNNLGNAFSVTRLQYYVAEIVLVHDGGQETPVANHWILVNANIPVNEMLGSFNITTLEAIKFGIGVEPAANHSDPSTYASNHPLAPKSPSMHWGWSAGYRFVAMEGKSGSSLTQTYELHALGDNNYFYLTLPTAGTANGNDLDIQINADYEKALMNIDVSSGVIIHGEVGAAKDLLENFNRHVFTSAEGNATMDVEEINLALNLVVYPNPSNGANTLWIDGLNDELTITISDVTGKLISTKNANAGNGINISDLSSGLYLLSVSNGQDLLAVKKVIITQ